MVGHRQDMLKNELGVLLLILGGLVVKKGDSNSGGRRMYSFLGIEVFMDYTYVLSRLSLPPLDTFWGFGELYH
jgi:hypothetical protein